jgi:hypothetical protein
VPVPQGQALQALAAVAVDHLGVEDHGDVRGRLDLLDQVVGHELASRSSMVTIVTEPA